jgi:hypothetical protein
MYTHTHKHTYKHMRKKHKNIHKTSVYIKTHTHTIWTGMLLFFFLIELLRLFYDIPVAEVMCNARMDLIELSEGVV